MFDTHMTSTPMQDGLEHDSVRAECKADRETALQVLKTCVATEVSCFGQILSYLGNHRHKARDLLEEVLTLEEAHVEELIDVLQAHGVGSKARRDGLPISPPQR